MGETNLRLHEQWHAKVDGVAAHDVVEIHDSFATGLGKVEDTANVVLLEHLTEGALVLLGELDDLNVDLVLGLGLEVLLDLGIGSIKLVVKRSKVVHNGGKPVLAQLTTKEDTLTRLRDAEVHGGLERSPVGLNEVLAEAGHLTGGSHLDAKEGVGASETGPGELGNLGGQVVTLDSHEVGGLGNVLADKGLGGNVNEVGAEDLADEGERTRGTEVALDDLEGGHTSLGILSANDLHVEGTGDVPGLGDLLRNLLDTVHGVLVQVGRREDEGGITRVDTSLLDVLTDSVDDQLTLGGNTININLLSTLDELADDDGVVRGDVGSSLKLVLEVLLAANDSHSSTRKDVTGTNKDRVADLLGKLLGSLDGGQLLPGGLVNSDGVEDLGELLSVLSLVDVTGVGSENVGLASLLETKGNVLGKLATDRHHHTAGVLELVDIHHTLIAQLFEIKAVCFPSRQSQNRVLVKEINLPASSKSVDVVSGLY